MLVLGMLFGVDYLRVALIINGTKDCYFLLIFGTKVISRTKAQGLAICKGQNCKIKTWDQNMLPNP